MDNIKCPFCGTMMEKHPMINRELYQCPNPECRCQDGGATLYKKPKPKEWLEFKQIAIDRSNRANLK